MASIYVEKLRRLCDGGMPRVLGFFVGCGGVSIGVERAGFQIAAAVENDDLAAQSHGLNYHTGVQSHSVRRDITSLEPADLARELELGAVEASIDVIVGGPPC